jgi:hypothetical protein
LKAWLLYAGVGLVVVLVGAGLAMLFVSAADAGAVWFAAGLAWVLQVIAFAGLVAVRERNELFLPAGWAVWCCGSPWWDWWRSGCRGEVFPLAPVLLSLVVFIFVLLLMEPLFLRRGLQTR